MSDGVTGWVEGKASVLRTSRLFSFSMTLVAIALLIYFGSQGALGPVQDVVAVPLNAAQSAISQVTRGVTGLLDDLESFRRLEKRNRDLEEALAVYQAELAELREKGHDYDRLSALLDFNRQGPDDWDYVTCNVIGRDTTGFVNAIQIDCGRRVGVEPMDPVVTEFGMVGRVTRVSATGAEVLLLTDPSSRVSVRLQESRADAVIAGQLTGDLLLSFIPVDAQVTQGERVVTSGLGQNFPADLLVGQVMSVALDERGMYQEARVRSLVEFGRLEIVQVIINFEPVDLAVFEQPAAP
jgi:rod shape-determining protein MreC